MTLRLYILIDAAALAVGTRQVAISTAASRHNVALEIIRTGSRGLYWLESIIVIGILRY